MAIVAPPPPDRAVDPAILTLPATYVLHRLYDPTNYGASATRFRYVGPFKRFDHHVDLGASRRLTPQDRGIIYAALELTGALVEVFGSRGGGESHALRYCGVRTERPLRLLDLRGNGALRAGTILGVCAQSHKLAQEWSRCFYEHPDIYGRLEGLIYPNAHNGEASIALYERADTALQPVPAWDFELRDPTHRASVVRALKETALPIRLV